MGFLSFRTAVRFNTLSAAFFDATRRGAIRAIARGPRPYASVVGGPPPLLLHPAPCGRAPATAVGGKGERCPALWGGAFFSAGALGTKYAGCGKLPQLPWRQALCPLLRRVHTRIFCPKAHALLEYSCRGLFTKTVITTRFPLPTSAELVFRKTFPSTRTFEDLVTLSADRFCYSTKAWQKRTRTTGAIFY